MVGRGRPPVVSTRTQGNAVPPATSVPDLAFPWLVLAAWAAGGLPSTRASGGPSASEPAGPVPRAGREDPARRRGKPGNPHRPRPQV